LHIKIEKLLFIGSSFSHTTISLAFFHDEFIKYVLTGSYCTKHCASSPVNYNNFTTKNKKMLNKILLAAVVGANALKLQPSEPPGEEVIQRWHETTLGTFIGPMTVPNLFWLTVVTFAFMVLLLNVAETESVKGVVNTARDGYIKLSTIVVGEGNYLNLTDCLFLILTVGCMMSMSSMMFSASFYVITNLLTSVWFGLFIVTILVAKRAPPTIFKAVGKRMLAAYARSLDEIFPEGFHMELRKRSVYSCIYAHHKYMEPIIKAWIAKYFSGQTKKLIVALAISEDPDSIDFGDGMQLPAVADVEKLKPLVRFLSKHSNFTMFCLYTKLTFLF